MKSNLIYKVFFPKKCKSPCFTQVILYPLVPILSFQFGLCVIRKRNKSAEQVFIFKLLSSEVENDYHHVTLEGILIKLSEIKFYIRYLYGLAEMQTISSSTTIKNIDTISLITSKEI